MNAITITDIQPNHGQSTTNPPANLAEAITLSAGWTDLSDHRRRELRYALTIVASMVKLPPEAVPLDCTFLSPRVVGRHSRSFGLNKKRHANVLSGLRYVLRRLGIGDGAPHQIKQLAPRWLALWNGLPPDETRYRLSRFFGFCSRRGIDPEAVDQTIVAAFVDDLVSNAIAEAPQRLGHRVTCAWNKLTRMSALALRPVTWRRGRQPYNLPLSAYPATFQEDVASYRRRMSASDPASLYNDLDNPNADKAKRPARPMRQSTINLRTDQIRLAATALVLSGRDPASIRSLRDLVDPSTTVRSIIEFYWERGGGKRGTFIGGIAEVLRQIAKHHCCLAAEAVAPIEALRERVDDNQTGICPRNRERLRQLIETETRAILIHLPDELLKRAAASDDVQEASRLARCAVALQILLVCPLRISNLAGLRLDRHLRREMTGERRITHIILAPEEVKNATQIEWPLSESTAAIIETWIKRYRTRAAAPGNLWLFPGQGEKGLLLSTLRGNLTNEIERISGVRVHPHLLRHFAAWLYLKHNPGAYEAVRRILGHKSLTTTLAAYTGLETDSAAKRLDDVVLLEKQSSRLIAARAFAPKTKRSAAKPGGR